MNKMCLNCNNCEHQANYNEDLEKEITFRLGYEQSKIDMLSWAKEQSRIFEFQAETYNDDECLGAWRAMELVIRYLNK